jgi:hypothetical protein
MFYSVSVCEKPDTCDNHYPNPFSSSRILQPADHILVPLRELFLD